jgi:hypothetical protein
MRLPAICAALIVLLTTATDGHAQQSSRADSPDLAASVSLSSGQVAPWEGPAPKDGKVGVLLGTLFPGGGQFYAGRPLKALAIIGVGAGAFALGVGECVNEVYTISDSNCEKGNTIALIGIAVPWVFGLVTAPADVREWNRKHEARAALSPVLRRRDGRTGLGLAMTF